MEAGTTGTRRPPRTQRKAELRVAKVAKDARTHHLAAPNKMKSPLPHLGESREAREGARVG
jgi:hypothetical protein